MDIGLVLKKQKQAYKVNREYKMKDKHYISRQYLVLEGITGIGQGSLATGAFIAGFVSFLGGGTALNGTIGVLPVALGVFQLIAALTLTGKHTRRQVAIRMAILLRALLTMVYVIPYITYQLTGSQDLALAGFILTYVAGFSVHGFVGPLVAGMLVDFTPIEIRGKYLAGRERISLVITSILTIGLGKVLDYFEWINLQGEGFLVIGIILGILGIINIYSLIKVGEIESNEVIERKGYLKSLLKPLYDKGFKKVIAFTGLWNFGLFFGITFIAIYMVEDLDLSYTYIMSMSVFATGIRVISAHFWGNMADKKSWLLTTGLSVTILGLTHFSWGFVTEENYTFLIPILNASSGFAWAGAAISTFNLQFMYANPEIRTISISVNAAVGGIMSLIGVRVGGFIVDRLSEFEWVTWFGSIGSMQLVFMGSGLFTLLCPIFVWIKFRDSV